MTSRRFLPVWIVAAFVAVLAGLLIAGWLQRPPATVPPSASASVSASASASASASVSVSATASASATAGPSSPAAGAPTLLAVGDTASCDNDNDAAVAALAARLPGEIALIGDLAYPDGSARAFADCFDPVWGPLRDRLRPVPGNHEYETSGASAYFAEFSPGAGAAGEGWYAYDVGTWRVLALNSNCGAVGCDEGSAQLTWLHDQLADAPACTLAYWHHPRWSGGMHGDNAFVDPLWQAVVAGGVDVVLGGHDHLYQRLSADGVREFVVGTGGRSLYAWGTPSAAVSEAQDNATYGVLQLTLRPGSYDWAFLPASGGAPHDSGSAACH